MTLNNVELHNIAETKQLWNGSYQLQRVPESVRVHLNDGAQNQSLVAANAEIRFVCDEPRARVTLSCGTETRFYVAFGTFLHPTAFPIGGAPLTIEIEMPENLRRLRSEYRENLAFDPTVFRILLPRATVSFFRVEGRNVRPPAADQLPKLRYLAYGTSITQGGSSTNPHLAYVAQAARRMGADIINLGMGGSCHAEKEMADYIAGRRDWDVATLALSVNMMGGFEVDEFRRRVSYMVNTVSGADASRPVVCITLYPYFVGLSGNHEAEEPKAAAFRSVLREVVADCRNPNVSVVEGPEILDVADGLSADMIHPSDFGMMRMGENLAKRLQAALGVG